MKKLLIALLLSSQLYSFEQSVDLSDPSAFWRIGTAGTVALYYLSNFMNATEAAFEWGMTETGRNGEEVDVFKILFNWEQATLKDWGSARLSWHWQMDIGRYEQRNVHVGDGSLTTFGMTPVFRFTKDFTYISPYIEMGIGFYWISFTEYIGHQLGSNFQFGDFMVLGAFFGKEKRWGLGVNFFHHSNFETVRPNEGFGSQLLVITYKY